MKMFTRPELRELRTAAATDPASLDRELLDRLIGQAEYALDCARLLEEAVHYPAEPYGEAEILVSRLTNGFNQIWNSYRYREDPGHAALSAGAK